MHYLLRLYVMQMLRPPSEVAVIPKTCSVSCASSNCVINALTIAYHSLLKVSPWVKNLNGTAMSTYSATVSMLSWVVFWYLWCYVGWMGLLMWIHALFRGHLQRGEGAMPLSL